MNDTVTDRTPDEGRVVDESPRSASSKSELRSGVQVCTAPEFNEIVRYQVFLASFCPWFWHMIIPPFLMSHFLNHILILNAPRDIIGCKSDAK